MTLLREPELGDDDYSDHEADGRGRPSSSAASRRAEKRGRVSFQPGTRPGAELSLYVKEEDPGVWKLAEPSYGARRVSKLVFFCFMRSRFLGLRKRRSERATTILQVARPARRTT